MENAVVTAVAEAVDGVSEDQVRQVLTALAALKEGDPVGTVLRDPDSGAIAVRVIEDGVPAWKVTAINGGEWRDMQPRLDGWKPLDGETK